MVITAELKLVGYNNTEKQMLRYLRDKVNKLLFKIAIKATAFLQDALAVAILATPAIQSLHGGKLQAELGVLNPTARVSELIKIWAQNFEVKHHRTRLISGVILGGFNISAIDANYTDVLSSQAAFQLNSNSSHRILPWLEWLLLYGDRIIIRDYDVEFGTFGRTGMAHMVKDQRRMWGVPPEFAGTATNNFVIEALEGVGTKLENFIARELA